MSLLKKIFFGGLIGSTILVILNGLIWQSSLVGSTMMFIFLALVSLIFGFLLLPNKPVREQFGIGFLVATGSLMIIGTAVYYMYGMTGPISTLMAGLLGISACVAAVKMPNTAYASLRFPKIILSPTAHITLLLQSSLFAFLLIGRNGDVMVSPWHALPPYFFLLYALSIGTLFYCYTQQKTTDITRYILTAIQCVITFGIAAIMYAHGYGFDGFIHRATEQWIFEHGFILPKAPYYIGQYSLIAFFAHLTGLSIFILDVFLLPLLAALILPIIIPFALRTAWNMPSEKTFLLFWLFPFLYFLSPHQTTPHNLVSLFFLIALFIGLPALYKKISFLPLWILSFAALATHPLLGVPLLLFLSALYVLTRTEQKKLSAPILFCYALLIIFFPTAMFAVNNYLGGFGLPTLTNPFAEIGKFIELLQLPYWYAKSSAWMFELLYLWQRCITPLVLILGAIGFFLQKNKPRASYVYLISFISFILSAWLLRSWIVFPNVAGPEQGNYPMRLLWTSPLFLLPWAMYAAERFITYLFGFAKNKLMLFCFITVGALIMMVSLYFSYPQRNIKARFPGYNVTTSDFNAVAWIHEQHAEPKYIVLSNPLVSVAALTKYGFLKHYQTPKGELFYYAIPSGGPLYDYYSKMLYEGQKKEFMIEAMNLTGTDTAYFVLNSYWGNADKIIEGAKKTADSWHVIDDGNVWIFTYTK